MCSKAHGMPCLTHTMKCLIWALACWAVVCSGSPYGNNGGYGSNNGGYNTLPYGAQPMNQQFQQFAAPPINQPLNQGTPIRAPQLPFPSAERHRPPVQNIVRPPGTQPNQQVVNQDPYQRPSMELYPIVRPVYVRPQATDVNVQDQVETAPTSQPPQPVTAGPAQPQQPQKPQKPTVFVQQVEPISPTSTPVAEFDCSTREDAVYASPGCVNHFFKCVKGTTFKYECPLNFYFSAKLVKCVSPQQVSECQSQVVTVQQQVVLTPSSTPAPTTPPLTIQANLNFCVERNFTQGYHHDGCSAIFYGCNGVVTNAASCPPGRVYDPADNTCDLKENVGVCGGTVKLIQSDDNESTTTVTEVKNVTTVVQSGSTVTDTQVTNDPIVIIQQPAQVITNTTTTTSVSSTVVETYCADKGLSTGHYGIGCSGFYYVCVSGYTYKMNCSANLYFSVDENVCDVKEHIPACGGTLPVRVITNSTVTVNQTTGLSSSSQIGQVQFDQNGQQIESIHTINQTNVDYQVQHDVTRRPVLKTDFQCGSRADGFYVPKNCQPTFIQCAGGYAYVQACPANLLFDVNVEQCNYRDVCGQALPPVKQQSHGNIDQLIEQTSTSTSQNGKSHIVTGAIITNTTTTTTTVTGQQVLAYDCSAKKDGFYQTGRCVPTYVECLNKIATNYDCPDGLVFSDNVCQHPDICANLKSSSSSVSTSTVTTTSSQTSNIGNRVDGQQPQPSGTQHHNLIVTQTVITQSDRFCINRPDGYQADGCTNVFYSCLGGASTTVACPTGLYFDVATQACWTKKNVPACGGQSVSQAQLTTWRNTTTTTITNTEVCDKPDGSYADDCTSAYYVCTNGNKYRYQCPARLVFSDASGACEFKEHVERCGGTPTTPATALPTPAASVVVTNTHQTSSSSVSSRVADKKQKINEACENLNDGVYGRSCSRFFLLCRSHRAYDFICPINRAFNTINGRCQTLDKIPGCQKENAPTLTMIEPQF